MVIGLCSQIGLAAPTRRPARTAHISKQEAKRRAPLITAHYVDLNLRLTQDGIALLATKHGYFPKARKIVRFTGSFEVRVYSSNLLLDVIPFSFPLMRNAGEPTKANVWLTRILRPGVRATTTVRIPYTVAVTHVVVVDLTKESRTRRFLIKKPKRLRIGLPGKMRSLSLPSALQQHPKSALEKKESKSRNPRRKTATRPKKAKAKPKGKKRTSPKKDQKPTGLPVLD